MSPTVDFGEFLNLSPMKKLNPFCLVVLYCLCCFVLTATADDGGIQVLMGEATTFIQGGPTIVNPVTIHVPSGPGWTLYWETLTVYVPECKEMQTQIEVRSTSLAHSENL